MPVIRQDAVRFQCVLFFDHVAQLLSKTKRPKHLVQMTQAICPPSLTNKTAKLTSKTQLT